jgi:TrmH family RNA methyltransferase
MIVSPKNRVLKDIRRLLRSKGDRAVLEGPHLIEEALAAGIELEQVLATPEFAALPDGAALLERLPGWQQVNPAVVDALADADTPRGVLAIARMPRAGVEALPVEPAAVIVYVEALQDPGNLGALARVAEAAGASGLALSPGTVHPNHPRALRASAGSLLRLPVAVGVTAEALDARVRGCSPAWVALAPRGGENLYSARLEGAIVLMIGSEGGGLSPELQARATRRVTVPLTPPVESLNATVAAAVVLFELSRRSGGANAGSLAAAGST